MLGKLSALAFMAFLAASLGAACTSTRTTGSVGPSSYEVRTPPPAAVRPAEIQKTFRRLAGDMAGRGLDRQKLEDFFTSPYLVYTNLPMETKLRELFGIYYRSELTREIQEKLYRLGYDITIDGRSGSGTRRAVARFQAAQNLPQTGEISDATLAAVNRVLKKGEARPLSGYKAPPAQKPSRSATYPQFTRADALPKILAHYQADREIFAAMSRRYHVPGQVAAAIMWVETGYGNFFGKYSAAGQLASMAAAGLDFKVVEGAVSDLVKSDAGARAWLADTAAKRGGWAADELAALLKYSFDNGHEAAAFPGSVYGAIGYGQFMPSNILKYGVDGTGDGRVDLFEKADAIFSIGNYLKAHGWKEGMDEEARRAVIMRYNKSGVYVNTVLYVADWLGRD